MSEPHAADQQKQAPRRGRPRSTQPRTASVTTWLPEREADRLMRIAHRNGVSVSSVVRRLVILQLRSDEPE